MAENIRVKNLYYMLSYAYQGLRESEFDRVAAEDFENIHDLFAALLVAGVARQLKSGLHRDYVREEASLSGVRGHVRLTESLQQQTLARMRLVCAYDEFTENSPPNQILKSTMLLLLRHGAVTVANKQQLRKLLLYFADVSELPLPAVRWNEIKYHRHQSAYRMLINICRLVADGLLLTNESGTYRLARWLNDEHMARLYERFVLSYYRKEHPKLNPRAAIIKWDLADGADSAYLPMLKSDITLTRGDRTLIIDTKWYTQTMQMNAQYGSITFRSQHLYQILAYVKNADTAATGNVAGVLLYAKTDEGVTPNHDVIIGGSRISLKTLDLWQRWSEIAGQLEALCFWLTPETVGPCGVGLG